ncbi:MAG: hypothetical protein LJF06_03025 [Gemmatimonadetes bacterium]|nr:hypothetical protein [Gemmatimonadota bacterium]
MRLIRLVALAGAAAAAGCSTLPAPFAPVRPPAYSALELERDISREDASHLDFAESATLATPKRDTLRGRRAIQAYMTTSPESSPPGFEFFTDHVYRCDARRGVELGKYRSMLSGGGEWYALWVRSEDGDWKIQRAVMVRPGDALPRPGPECVSTGAEVAAEARFTFSLAGPPFMISTAHPHRDLKTAGSYPFQSTEVRRADVILASTYRLNRWLVVGGMWVLLSKVRTTYHTPFGPMDWLDSGGNLWAITAGYQGRNITLDAGPALVRTHWQWGNYSEFPGASAGYSHLGALVEARGVIPLRSDVNLEVLVQRRFLGSDPIPGTDPVRYGSRDGFLLGFGLAFRRTER